MPFDKEDRSGIVYVWVGSKADPEEARITEEIAREMYDGVRRTFKLIYSILLLISSKIGISTQRFVVHDVSGCALVKGNVM